MSRRSNVEKAKLDYLYKNTENLAKYKHIWNKLKEYLYDEKEEVKVLIDPCAEEYFELCNILGTLDRVLDEMQELEKEVVGVYRE